MACCQPLLIAAPEISCKLWHHQLTVIIRRACTQQGQRGHRQQGACPPILVKCFEVIGTVPGEDFYDNVMNMACFVG